MSKRSTSRAEVVRVGVQQAGRPSGAIAQSFDGFSVATRGRACGPRDLTHDRKQGRQAEYPAVAADGAGMTASDV
jgi:hypothetical protein